MSGALDGEHAKAVGEPGCWLSTGVQYQGSQMQGLQEAQVYTNVLLDQFGTYQI